jgi:hypothetical protein
MVTDDLLKLLVVKGCVQKVVQPLTEDPGVVLEEGLPYVFGPLV